MERPSPKTQGEGNWTGPWAEELCGHLRGGEDRCPSLPARGGREVELSAAPPLPQKEGVEKPRQSAAEGSKTAREGGQPASRLPSPAEPSTDRRKPSDLRRKPECEGDAHQPSSG